MNNEHIHQQLLRYLDGELAAEERQQFEQQLAADPELFKLLEQYRLLGQSLDEVPMEAPPSSLREQFYQQLEDAQQSKYTTPDSQPMTKRPRVWWSAAAVALLVIGVGFGNLWNRNRVQQAQINTLVAEVQNTQKMLALAMLEQSSASQRIKAMNRISEVATVDPQIIEALLLRLNTDNNINVRLKAAEALQHFTQQQGVAEALIRSLEHQDNPQIQIALIDILVSIKANQAVDRFNDLILQDTIAPVVKERAAAGIEHLL